MAVQTSSITTATNGNLSLSPNGTGQVIASPLGGSGTLPVGTVNSGQLSLFSPADLTAGAPAATSELMLDIAGNVRKATAQDVVNATDAISLTDLSVTTAAVGTVTGGLTYNNANGTFTFTPVAAAASGIGLTDLSVTQAVASGAGTLTYNNGNGVFTYTPPTRGGLGAIALTDISVATAATGTAAGGLAYDNTTGVLTYTPVSAAAGGIALTDLSVTQATAAGAGALTYNNANGVFNYIPPLFAGKNGVGYDTGDNNFQVTVHVLPDR